MFRQLGNGLRRIVIDNDVLTFCLRRYANADQFSKWRALAPVNITCLPLIYRFFTRAENGFHRRNLWDVNIGGDAEHGWNREFNNFNIIYLLTRGEPVSVGNSAGATDLLVTWLYKLTVDQQKFNMGAVIGIFTFVVLAVVSLITYRSSGSYKDEEAFK